jgi:hypothetical protein
MPTTTGLRPRDVTAAIRQGTTCTSLKTRANDDGSATVTIDNRAARYLGVARDPAVAANRLGYCLGRPVVITWQSWDTIPWTVLFTLAPAGPDALLPVDPGGSHGVPSYTTVADVLGWTPAPGGGLTGFPANRAMASLVKLAIDAGCRPHLYPAPSPRGRQYRVMLWHSDPALLFGCIDAQESSGRFAAAWLQWGHGDERKITDPKEVRAQLTSARDLHLGRTGRRGQR